MLILMNLKKWQVSVSLMILEICHPQHLTGMTEEKIRETLKLTRVNEGFKHGRKTVPL